LKALIFGQKFTTIIFQDPAFHHYQTHKTNKHHVEDNQRMANGVA
jgi:hypothetical protein